MRLLGMITLIILPLVARSNLRGLSGIEDGNLTFMGISYSRDEFRSYQNYLNRAFSTGEWRRLNQTRLTNDLSHSVDDYDRMNLSYFSKPCVFEHPITARYIGESCLQSSAYTGDNYVWKYLKISNNKLGIGKSEDIQTVKTRDVDNFEKYPEDLAKWNPVKMCALMNGRNLLFYGDSMQSQFYFTYASAAFAHHVANQEMSYSDLSQMRKTRTESCDKMCEYGTWAWDHGCELPFVVDCGEEYPNYSIMYTRSDQFAEDIGRETHYMQLMLYHGISVVFLNTGAHYQNDIALVTNLNKTLHTIYTNVPHATVVYRNTPHGHEHCQYYSHSHPRNEYISKDLKDYDHPEYNWDKFDGQNRLVYDFLQSNFPQVLYIDVATSTNVRFDSHVSATDCLHYCLPGPVDSWLTFHFHALWNLPNHKIRPAESSRIYMVAASPPQLLDGTIVLDKVSKNHFLIYNMSKMYISTDEAHILMKISGKSGPYLLPGPVVLNMPTLKNSRF